MGNLDLHSEIKEPQDQEEAKKHLVILKARELNLSGDPIAKLISSRWYVYEDTNLLDIADELTDKEDIHILGVVDSNGSYRGIIQKKDLFDLQARPFGRDVMKQETVRRVITKFRIHRYDTNIFAFAEHLKDREGKYLEDVHVVVSQSKEFLGTFTDQDLLLFLSHKTYEDISLVKSIQRKLVKERSSLELDKFGLATFAALAKGIGGDLYTINHYQERHWLLSLNDIAGKGTTATIIGTAFYGIINSFDKKKGLSNLMRALNSFLIDTFSQEQYVSSVFMDFDTSKGILNVCDLGHGYVYIFRNKKLLRVKSSEDAYPLGVVPEIKPQIFKYNLQKNDIVIALSDGLIEQANTLSESFGMARVKMALENSFQKSPRDIREEIISSFNDFRKKASLFDDVSILVLKYYA
jgi:serine phosphatase RsbU (regulator of sigma subunit)